jgi:hypothetical protein
MAIRNFPDYSEGDLPSAAELNRLSAVVESLTNFPSPAGSYDDTGLHLRAPDAPLILGQISGGSNPYSWLEFQSDENGVLQPVPGGLTGTPTVNPAYEINGDTSVSAGTIVVLYPGNGEYWLFSTSMSSGNTMLEIDQVCGTNKTFTISNVSDLQLNESSGFQVTSPALNQALVALNRLWLRPGFAVAWNQGCANTTQQAALVYQRNVTIFGTTGSIQIGVDDPNSAGFTVQYNANSTPPDTATGTLFGPVSNTFYQVLEAVTTYTGINGTGLTSVDVRGGIVVGGSGGGSGGSVSPPNLRAISLRA